MTSQNVSSDARRGHTGKTPAGRITKLPTIEIPNRYSIREIGPEKGLSCVEAPNLTVYIKLGLCIPASAVSKAAPGTIFLDGVAQYGPLLDHSKQVYNFDHHEGCVRLFTLSTCEQVLLMIKKGLDLRCREWKIYANDPDLDTILAVWLLLNHIRINEQESIRENILFPLVRLQGSIDSLGLEMKIMTGLPATLLNQCQRIIDHLRRKELQLKKDGLWEQTDFLPYTADILYAIDQIVYESKKLGKSLGVEELARVTLPGNRVAVVLQSDMGIYEIEPHLKKIYGGNIGLVILRRSQTAYTLRQVDPFLKGTLEDVYEKLNFIDPAVKYRNMNNKWGGSSDIGGSPREIGTRLTPEEIANACWETFQKKSFFPKIRQYALAVAACLVVFSAAAFSAAYWDTGKGPITPSLNAIVSDPYFGFGVVMLLLTSLILVSVANRRLWQFGIIFPEGKTWWFFLPITVVAGLMGGAWVPTGLPSSRAFNDMHLLLICILLPFAAEYLFRSLLHGIIALQSRIQSSLSNYFISWPNLGAAFLYSLFLTFFPVFQDGAIIYPLSMNVRSGWSYFAAFIFSVSLGVVRERSHSFFSSYLFHLIPVFLSIFLPSILIFTNQILNIIRPIIPF